MIFLGFAPRRKKCTLKGGQGYIGIGRRKENTNPLLATMQRISRGCISSIQDAFQTPATKTILHQWTRQQQTRTNRDFARKLHSSLTGTSQPRCTRQSILGSLSSSTSAKRIKSLPRYSRQFSGSSACRLNDSTSDTGSSSQHRLTSELPTKGRMVLDTPGNDASPIWLPSRFCSK